MAVNSIFNVPGLLELLKSLKNCRVEWKLKTPMQKWCYLYGIGRAGYRLIRIPLMNDVHNPHWFGYFALFYAALVMVLSLYAVIYYAYIGQIEMGLPSTCLAVLFIGVRTQKFALNSAQLSSIEWNIAHFSKKN